MKTDQELKQTDPALCRVARENGTKARFSGKYVGEKSDGMYHCAIYDAPCGGALQTV